MPSPTEAAAHNDTVLIGHCYDLSVTPPYGPWRELLARLPSNAGLPPLPAALADDGDAEPVGETELFRRVHDVLVSVTAIRPAVVVMEDLHWADPASLDLLRYLGRRLTDLPLLLIVTYRSDEITRRHPLAALLPALVREAPTERIDLHPLDEAALSAAGRQPVSAASGSGSTARELCATLRGGQSVLRSGVAPQSGRGAPARSGGTALGLGNLELARVPTLLQQVVEGRLARLGDTARTHLSIAAVIGQRVPLAVWQSVGGFG